MGFNLRRGRCLCCSVVGNALGKCQFIDSRHPPNARWLVFLEVLGLSRYQRKSKIFLIAQLPWILTQREILGALALLPLPICRNGRNRDCYDLPKYWRFPWLKKWPEEGPQFWNRDEMKTSGDRTWWGDKKGEESANVKKKKGAWGYSSQHERIFLSSLSSPCLQLRDGTHRAKARAPAPALRHQCCRIGFPRGEFEVKNPAEPFSRLQEVNTLSLADICGTSRLPRWLSSKESACNERGFDPYVRKIPWRRSRQPTPIFLPGESLVG